MLMRKRRHAVLRYADAAAITPLSRRHGRYYYALLMLRLPPPPSSLRVAIAD